MSAPAATLQPVTTPWVKMSPAMLIGLPRMDGVEFTELKCALLVAVRSSGRGECELDLQQISRTVAVSTRHCRDAIGNLTDTEGKGLAAPLLSATEAGDGRTRYRFNDRAVNADLLPAPETPLACPKCHSTRTEVDAAWRPIPSSILTAVLCCRPAMAICLLAIAEASMRWDKAARRPRATEVRLSIDYFERVTGLPRRTIQEALAALQAEELAFIGETASAGRPSIYWARPENWTRGPKRAARTVTISADRAKSVGGESAAKVESEPVSDSANDKAETDAAEFFLFQTGRCLDCGHRGVLKPVLSGVEGGSVPVPAPADAAGGHNRGRPPSKRPYTPPIFGPEGMMRPELRPVYEYLVREWTPKMRGLTPDPIVVSEIFEAMGGAPIGYLEWALGDRERYVLTARYPYKAIVAIAHDAGKTWRFEEAQRVAQERKLQSFNTSSAAATLESARRWLADPNLPEADRAEILRLCPELKP